MATPSVTQTADLFRSLRLGPIAEQLERWLAQPRNSKRSHVEFAHDLATGLLNHKRGQAMARTVRRTGALTSAALSEVWTGPARGLPAAQLANLAGCAWVRHGAPLVVTGPTHAGKTYLASALIRAATDEGLKVERIDVSSWLLEHEDERVIKGVPASCKKLLRADLLVLDNFANQPANTHHTHMLMRLIEARSEPSPKAMLVLSRRPMSAWSEQFECPDTLAAMAARLGWGEVITLERKTSTKGKPGRSS